MESERSIIRLVYTLDSRRWSFVEDGLAQAHGLKYALGEEEHMVYRFGWGFDQHWTVV